MGMFDIYQPAGTLRCPVDGNPLKEWQGKDGPCGLFIWREGERHPFDEWVDEELRQPPSALERFTLPTSFTIYCYDCPRHQPITATCATVDGVWRLTRINSLNTREEARANERFWQRVESQTVSREERAPAPREFVLIDLTSQMPYLPLYARGWPRERLLAWLRVWGEVYQTETRHAAPGEDWFAFQSWVGRWTYFVLSSDGGMYIPGTHIHAWEERAVSPLAR